MRLTWGLLVGVGIVGLGVGPVVAAASPGFDHAGRVARITGGEPTTGDSAVVALAIYDVCQGTREVYCTGTLIAPRVVLTAAHCVSVPVETVEVFFGADVEGDGEGLWLRAAALRAPSSFDPSDYGDDIGAVILGQDAAVEPAPIWLDPLTDAQLGVDARIVGFGIPEPGAGEIGRKRTGLTTVESVGPLSFDIVANPAMSCQVDSGGPVLLRDAEDLERVAGITSTGDAFCQSYATNTRVDAYLESFLDAVLAEAAEGSLVPPPPLSEDTCPGCSVFGCAEGEICDDASDSCVPAPSAAEDGDEARGCAVRSSPSSTPWALVWLGLTAGLLATRRRSARPTGS